LATGDLLIDLERRLADPVTMRATSSPSPGRSQRLARLYDEEIYPLYARRFGDLLLRPMVLAARSSILEVGCASGALTADLVRALDGHSRVIALDASSTLLDLARARIGDEHAGRRVFFRTHDPRTTLPFAEETFDTVLATVSWSDLPEPGSILRDFARVAKPGGQVILAMPLADTWSTFLDIYGEVLQRRGHQAGLGALAAYRSAIPSAETVAHAMEDAGIHAVSIELASWDLLFRSAREFFFAPLIEYGPLPRWKEIAGKGAAMQAVFSDLKETIDTYFAGRAFPVSICGGGFSGRTAKST
jgi:SAM-dependent methyltransferase